MAPKTRLELVWIGKENRPRLKTRILVEDPEKSYHPARRVTDGALFGSRSGDRPWAYLLIPHDSISETKTFQGFAATFDYRTKVDR